MPDAAVQKSTEAIQHIKHGIDQGFTAACRIFGSDLKGRFNFPWSDNLQGVKSSLIGRKIPEALHQTILSFNPYPAIGAGPIKQNVVRQSALIANKKHSVNLTIIPRVETMLIRAIVYKTDRAFVAEFPVWDCVNQEFEIARFPEGTEFVDDRKFPFRINLNEGPPVDKFSAEDVIACFGQYAEDVVLTLRKMSLDFVS